MKIRKDIKDFRKAKGIKSTQELLSTIYEKLDKSKVTKEQRENIAKENKYFFQKTIQRLENNFQASEKTAEMYAKALGVSRNDISADKQDNSTKILELEPYNFEQINSYRDLTKIIDKSRKRKIILDYNENSLLPGQSEIISELIKRVDKAKINLKNMSNVFEADSFEIKELNNSELNHGVAINNILAGLKNGNAWIKKEHYKDNIGRFSSFDDREDVQELIAEEINYFKSYNKDLSLIPSNSTNDGRNPIFLKAAEFRFWSYWPYEEDSVSQNPAEIVYDANLPKDRKSKKYYVTKVLAIDYLLLVFSNNQNLSKYTVANPAYNSVISVIDKNLNSLKFINKKLNANFDEVENILKSDPEFYPKNYLEESDINLIYSDPGEYLKQPEDYEDFIFSIKENSEKIFDNIISNKRFINYLVFEYPNAKEDNIVLKSKKISVKEINKDKKSRLSFMKKTNLTDFLMEDIQNVFTYYFDSTFKGSVEDLNQKVTEIFLVGGQELEEELKKTRPIKEIY